MLTKLVVALAAVAAAAPPPAPKGPLNQVTDSYIRRGVRAGYWYGEATLYSGAEASFAVNKNKTILEWYKKQVDDGILNADGTIIDWDLNYYSLDDYRIGNNFLWWYQRTGDDKYKVAADIVRHQLDRHPRNPSGGFWHRQPTYPNQMWLDGIFMADSFYARYTKEFQPANKTAWDDVARQYDLIEEHTRNHTSKLLVHGYDEGKTAIWADPVTGASPLVWNRAVGWYFMSLTESLDVWPKSHPGRKRLVEYFVTLAEGLRDAYERDGGWWLVMSEGYPGKPGNYIESSSQAMFVYGLLHGLRTGLLSEKKFGKVAEKGYKELVDKFLTKNADGTLNFIETVEVGSLNSNATFEVSRSKVPSPHETMLTVSKQYYVGVPRVINDNRGGGALLLALAEWELRK
jgi:rhamnogalacturonyl hydrolase YesR